MADNTTYDPRITAEFIMECAKTARVQVMSSQVILTGDRAINMKNLTIPPIYFIEWVGASEGEIQINLRLRA